MRCAIYTSEFVGSDDDLSSCQVQFEICAAAALQKAAENPDDSRIRRRLSGEAGRVDVARLLVPELPGLPRSFIRIPLGACVRNSASVRTEFAALRHSSP